MDYIKLLIGQLNCFLKLPPAICGMKEQRGWHLPLWFISLLHCTRISFVRSHSTHTIKTQSKKKKLFQVEG